MAKPVRDTRAAKTGEVWPQPSSTMGHVATGFSERDSGYAPPSEGPEQRRLNRRQQALRKTLFKSSATSAIEAGEFSVGEFSAGDGIEVALDSLRRSSAMVEEMIHQSAKTRRQFDLRSQRLDEQLRRNREQLAALVGDGR